MGEGGGEEGKINCVCDSLPRQNYKVWEVDQEADHPEIPEGAESELLDSCPQELLLLRAWGLEFFSDPGKRTEAPMGPIH